MPGITGCPAWVCSWLGPQFVVWLGFGVSPKIVVALLMAFFPVVILMVTGQLSATIGAGPAKTFDKIRLPASLPHLFSGLKVGATLAVTGAVVGSNDGLGYVIQQANGNLDTPVLFAGLIIMSALGIILFAAAELRPVMRQNGKPGQVVSVQSQVVGDGLGVGWVGVVLSRVGVVRAGHMGRVVVGAQGRCRVERIELGQVVSAQSQVVGDGLGVGWVGVGGNPNCGGLLLWGRVRQPWAGVNALSSDGLRRLIGWRNKVAGLVAAVPEPSRSSVMKAMLVLPVVANRSGLTAAWPEGGA